MGDGRLHRVCGHEVGAADHERLRSFVSEIGYDGAYCDLDLLGSDFADLDIVLLAQIVLDVAGEHVAGRPDAGLLDQASERDHGDFGGASSDVHDHVSLRGFDVKSDSQGRGHGFENQVHISSSCVLGRVAHGPDFDLGGA